MFTLAHFYLLSVFSPIDHFLDELERKKHLRDLNQSKKKIFKNSQCHSYMWNNIQIGRNRRLISSIPLQCQATVAAWNV